VRERAAEEAAGRCRVVRCRLGRGRLGGGALGGGDLGLLLTTHDAGARCARWLLHHQLPRVGVERHQLQCLLRPPLDCVGAAEGRLHG